MMHFGSEPFLFPLFDHHDDELAGKESQEARVILEEAEIGQGEARHGSDFRHEDGGAEWEGAQIHRRDDVDPAPEVA